MITRLGYLIMELDEKEHEWFNIANYDTPEALRETILSAYEGYLCLMISFNFDEPAEEEIWLIQKRAADLRLLCNANVSLFLFTQRLQYAQNKLQGRFIQYVQQAFYLSTRGVMRCIFLRKNDFIQGYVQNLRKPKQYFYRRFAVSAFYMLHMRRGNV